MKQAAKAHSKAFSGLRGGVGAGLAEAAHVPATEPCLSQQLALSPLVGRESCWPPPSFLAGGRYRGSQGWAISGFPLRGPPLYPLWALQRGLVSVLIKHGQGLTSLWSALYAQLQGGPFFTWTLSSSTLCCGCHCGSCSSHQGPPSSVESQPFQVTVSPASDPGKIPLTGLDPWKDVRVHLLILTNVVGTSCTCEAGKRHPDPHSTLPASLGSFCIFFSIRQSSRARSCGHPGSSINVT